MPDRDSEKTRREQSGLKILLVSKDSLFARVAKAKLAGWGHTVHHELDLAAARQWCRLDPLDLVIIDFDLPDGAGAALCRQLRGTARPGYVYLLGYGSTTDRQLAIAALEAGADSFAHKPLHPGELRACIEHARRLLSLSNTLFHGSGADLVSGVLARNAFERLFRVIFAQCERSRSTGLLTFVEVTNMAEILRHDGIDGLNAIEMELAGRVAALPRASDMVGRLKQGQFCLMLTNTSSLTGHAVADRLSEVLQDLGASSAAATRRPQLAISMVDFPGGWATPYEVLERAPRTSVAAIIESAQPTALPTVP